MCVFLYLLWCIDYRYIHSTRSIAGPQNLKGLFKDLDLVLSYKLESTQGLLLFVFVLVILLFFHDCMLAWGSPGSQVQYKFIKYISNNPDTGQHPDKTKSGWYKKGIQM